MNSGLSSPSRRRAACCARWGIASFRPVPAIMCKPRARSRKGVGPGDIEVWFADEARIGQKNKITRRWTKRGSRPSAPKDQRTASAYIFGAICLKEGKGATIVMPRCGTEAMNLHLAEIATQIAPGAHAALLVDQAGWHLSARLTVPPNMTPIPLPAKCPDLNPQENVWQFMRDNWL
jgi:DDE superfamily endonuclease